MRPRPEPDESWPGYLGRLAEFNALDGIKGLERVFGVSVAALLCGRLTNEKKSFGVEVPAASESISGILTKTRKSLLTRVCPLCLDNKNATHSALWDFPLMLRCALHDCLLVDRCDACQQPIRHDRPTLASCKCGKRFRTMLADKVPAWVAAMESVYAEALLSNNGLLLDQNQFLLQRAGARGMRFFSCFDLTPRRITFASRHPTSASSISSDDFGVLEKAFTLHPLGFSLSFEAWFRIASAQQLVSIRSNWQLDKFQKIWQRLIDLRAPIASCEGLDHRERQSSVTKSACVTSIRSNEHSVIPVSEAAKKLRISIVAVRQLMKVNEREFLVGASSGRAITVESLQGLLMLLDQHCVSGADCELVPLCGLAYAFNLLVRSELEDGCSNLLQAICAGKFVMHSECETPQSLRDYRIRQSDFFCWCADRKSAS